MINSSNIITDVLDSPEMKAWAGLLKQLEIGTKPKSDLLKMLKGKAAVGEVRIDLTPTKYAQSPEDFEVLFDYQFSKSTETDKSAFRKIFTKRVKAAIKRYEQAYGSYPSKYGNSPGMDLQNLSDKYLGLAVKLRDWLRTACVAEPLKIAPSIYALHCYISEKVGIKKPFQRNSADNLPAKEIREYATEFYPECKKTNMFQRKYKALVESKDIKTEIQQQCPDDWKIILDSITEDQHKPSFADFLSSV